MHYPVRMGETNNYNNNNNNNNNNKISSHATSVPILNSLIMQVLNNSLLSIGAVRAVRSSEILANYQTIRRQTTDDSTVLFSLVLNLS
jgi:hypothetical protein